MIVTGNLVDFRELLDGVEAQHPDEFLCGLLDLAPETPVEIVRAQRRELRRPPRTLEEVLGALRRI